MARPLPVNLLLAGTGAVLLVSGVGGTTIGNVLKGQFGEIKTNPETGTKSTAFGEGPESGEAFRASPIAFGAGQVARPFAGGTRTSIDEGVDYSLLPGEPIYAMGTGIVKGIEPNWYAGQPFMWYEVLSGPLRGRNIYIAEQIVPLKRPGQLVRAGEPIARYASTGTGLETGLATAGGQTVAKTEGWVEAFRNTAASRAGNLFDSIMRSLGLQ